MHDKAELMKRTRFWVMLMLTWLLIFEVIASKDSEEHNSSATSGNDDEDHNIIAENELVEIWEELEVDNISCDKSVFLLKPTINISIRYITVIIVRK